MSDASDDSKKRFAGLFDAIAQQAAKKAKPPVTLPAVSEVVNPKMDEYAHFVEMLSRAANGVKGADEERCPMSPIDVFCGDVLDRLRKSVESVPKALANLVKVESIENDDADDFANTVVKLGHEGIRTAWIVSEYAKPAFVMLWRLTKQETDRRMAAWYTRLSERLREAHSEMCGPGYPFRHSPVLRMQGEELFGIEAYKPRMN